MSQIIVVIHLRSVSEMKPKWLLVCGILPILRPTTIYVISSCSCAL